MVHRSATSREIATKKQPYVFRKAVPWCTLFGTLPRANKAPLGLCCRSVRKATDTPCSRPPMVHRPAASREITTKKQPYAPVNPHLPHNSPGTLPRPKNAPLGRFCPAVRKTRGAGCSRPRWRTRPQRPGKSQQKNTPQLLARCLLWCTIGDSNPGPTD